jgi:hypothetical protein
MSTQAHTPGPWHVLDFRASEMRRLGWVGPSIDRILITNMTAREVAACDGENSVIARIQFDNRPEELAEVSIADARLIAAAPDLYAAILNSDDAHWTPAMRAAMAKAEGLA